MPRKLVEEVKTDETKTRRYRKRTGDLAKQRGLTLRLAPDVGNALELEADTTGRSKTAIIEDALRRRLKVRR